MKNFNTTSALIGALVCAGILSLSSATRVDPNRPDPTLEVISALAAAQVQQAAALEAVAEALRAPDRLSGEVTLNLKTPLYLDVKHWGLPK